MSSDGKSGPGQLIFVLFEFFVVFSYFLKETLPFVAPCGPSIAVSEAANCLDNLALSILRLSQVCIPVGRAVLFITDR